MHLDLQPSDWWLLVLWLPIAAGTYLALRAVSRVGRPSAPVYPMEMARSRRDATSGVTVLGPRPFDQDPKTRSRGGASIRKDEGPPAAFSCARGRVSDTPTNQPQGGGTAA